MFDANNQSNKYLLKFFWPHISHELKNLRTMKDGGIFIYPLSICYPYKDNSERKYYTNICCKSASIPNLSNSFEPISSFVTARGLHCVYQITSNQIFLQVEHSNFHSLYQKKGAARICIAFLKKHVRYLLIATSFLAKEMLLYVRITEKAIIK